MSTVEYQRRRREIRDSRNIDMIESGIHTMCHMMQALAMVAGAGAIIGLRRPSGFPPNMMGGEPGNEPPIKPH